MLQQIYRFRMHQLYQIGDFAESIYKVLDDLRGIRPSSIGFHQLLWCYGLG